MAVDKAEPAARAFLDDQVAHAGPAEVRRVVLALGTLQRLTFRRPQSPGTFWSGPSAGPVT